MIDRGRAEPDLTEVAPTSGRGWSSRWPTASSSSRSTNEPAVVDGDRRPAGKHAGSNDTASTGTWTRPQSGRAAGREPGPAEWQRDRADGADGPRRRAGRRHRPRSSNISTRHRRRSLRRERGRRAGAREGVVLPELEGHGRRRALPGRRPTSWWWSPPATTSSCTTATRASTTSAWLAHPARPGRAGLRSSAGRAGRRCRSRRARRLAAVRARRRRPGRSP